MSNADRIPSLADVIRAFIASALSDVHTAIPGRVESYDATLQRASIQPLIKEAFESETGERIVARLPVIPGVPVQFPSGGGYRITFPVQPGDTGLLLFSQASLDVWLNEGGEVDPLDDRRFHLSDGIFIPGVRSFKTPIIDASSEYMTLGKEGGPQIYIDENTISFGSNEGGDLDSVALYQELKTELEELKTKFNAHIHAVSGAATLVPSAPNLLGPGWPADFSSSVVKAKK